MTAPVANNDTAELCTGYAASTDVQINHYNGVMLNDVCLPYNQAQAVLDTGPAHASFFSLSHDGSFRYTSNTGYTGPDSFTYHVTDANGNSNVATCSITVLSVADWTNNHPGKARNWISVGCANHDGVCPMVELGVPCQKHLYNVSRHVVEEDLVIYQKGDSQWLEVEG